MYRSLYQRLLNKEEKLSLVGLGYVGMPIAVAFARKIDVVIEDFPWAAVRRGRQPIENIICPEHLIIYHLPFEEDDVQGYGPMIRRVISRIHMIPDIRIMDKFLQTEIL